MAENDHNPLFGISLAEKDRVLTLLTQSDGILGLIKHVDESTPPDYLANSVWLLQDVLEQIKDTLEATKPVRVPAT